jgi:hypothetical protein
MTSGESTTQVEDGAMFSSRLLFYFLPLSFTAWEMMIDEVYIQLNSPT